MYILWKVESNVFVTKCRMIIFVYSSPETNITLPPNNVAPQFGIPLSSNFKIGITSAYAVIFIIALFGNSLGLFLVLKKSTPKNVTNLFIANMAVADLLLTLTMMPFSVASFYRDVVWFGGIMGTITCKALFYVIPVSIAATVLTMLIISIDRFYAVFYPLREKLFRKPRVLSAIIWILSIALMIPYPFFYQVQPDPARNVHTCVQVWPWEDPNDPTFKETYRVLEIFHICVFVILYVLPLFIMAIVYSLICRKLWRRIIPGNQTDRNRIAAEMSKRRVVRHLVILAVVFAVCWFPTYVNHYFWYVRPEHGHKLPLEIYFVFFWIAHANSAINPCLYVLMNANLRRELVSTLASFPFQGITNCQLNCPNTFFPRRRRRMIPGGIQGRFKVIYTHR